MLPRNMTEPDEPARIVEGLVLLVELAGSLAPMIDMPEVSAMSRARRVGTGDLLRLASRLTSMARAWRGLARCARGDALASRERLVELWKARAVEDAHGCGGLVLEVWAAALSGCSRERIAIGARAARGLLASALGHAAAVALLGPGDGYLERCFPGPPVSERYALGVLADGLLLGDAAELHLAEAVKLPIARRPLFYSPRARGVLTRPRRVAA